MEGRAVVIECGAGTAIPSVRTQCEKFAARQNATLIRINPREAKGPAGTISLPIGSLQALSDIKSAMVSKEEVPEAG